MKARIIKTGEIVDVYHEPQHGQITNIYKESVLVDGRMWSEDELDFCVKANEAPEKIYLDEDKSWHLTNPNGDSVEYIRADAFIEKAFEFFGDHLWEYIDVQNANCTTFINIDGDKLKEDFRKYMEDSL